MAASEHRGREGRLFHRVNAAVARRVDHPMQRPHQRHIEDHLAEGEADRHAAEAEWVGRPQNAQARNVDVVPDRKRQQVDGTPKLAQRLEDLADGDGSSPVLVERLGSHDQNAATGDFRVTVTGRVVAGSKMVPSGICRPKVSGLPLPPWRVIRSEKLV